MIKTIFVSIDHHLLSDCSLSLMFLPDDVLGYILCQIIDSKQFRDMSSFSQTCRKMNEIYCEIQNTLRKSEIEKRYSRCGLTMVIEKLNLHHKMAI